VALPAKDDNELSAPAKPGATLDTALITKPINGAGIISPYLYQEPLEFFLS
jgi:hypothetical protein